MKIRSKVKDIPIKNWTYYIFHDIIDIENFHQNNIKIDQKSYKNILIYHNGYITIKEYAKIYSVNPIYHIMRYVKGYFKEIHGNKYLMLAPTNGSKEKSKKYEELWIKIRDLIKSKTKNFWWLWLWWKIHKKSNLIQMMNYL